jgi:glucose-6-phosphate 1-dehydrogenase
MTAKQAPQTLVILGANGDLCSRLLLPGIGSLVESGQFTDLHLIGCDRQGLTADEWRATVDASLKDAGISPEVRQKLTSTTSYEQADVTNSEDLSRLLEHQDGSLVLYFALPPTVTIAACQELSKLAVPPGTRFALEKPFGQDARTAAEFNELLAGMLPESQVHRVDHFLGLATVLNIVGLRFANRTFEPLLNNQHVASVEIVWDEDLALEGRGGYYDHAGALVDMIQSHLLQVLGFLTMEAPSAIEARDIRDGTARILRATSIWNDDPVKFSRRARYSAGEIGDRHLPSYRDEEGVDPSRQTETFAEIVVGIATWRWAGVPFRLRSGKALGNPRKEAIINFRPPAHLPVGLSGMQRPERFRIGLGFGADKLRVDLTVNGPGDPWSLDPATLEADLGPGSLSEYAEVLKGILSDDPTLSVRGDAAVECWRIIDSVRRAWQADEVPLLEYPAGSHGPSGWPEAGLPS